MELTATILNSILGQVIAIIESTGAVGVFLLMALESANIPVPSELIMPFAGYVVSVGGLGFWIIVLAGALGNLVGSLVSYAVGFYGGRPFLEKYGKYFFIRTKDLEMGDRAFLRHGPKIAFWSRLIPVVRTFISLPAGINRSPIKKFAIYTFLGSLIWSWFLTEIGFLLGENWLAVRPFFDRFSILVAGIIIFTIAVYIWKHVKK